MCGNSRSNVYAEKTPASVQPFDVHARCQLKVSKDFAFIHVIDTGAPVKRLTFGLKYSLVDILGIIGKLQAEALILTF